MGILTLANNNHRRKAPMSTTAMKPANALKPVTTTKAAKPKKVEQAPPAPSRIAGLADQLQESYGSVLRDLAAARKCLAKYENTERWCDGEDLAHRHLDRTTANLKEAVARLTALIEATAGFDTDCCFQLPSGVIVGIRWERGDSSEVGIYPLVLVDPAKAVKIGA